MNLLMILCLDKFYFIDIVLFQLELILNKADGGDISTYVPNGEWDLIGENKMWNIVNIKQSLEDA